MVKVFGVVVQRLWLNLAITGSDTDVDQVGFEPSLDSAERHQFFGSVVNHGGAYSYIRSVSGPLLVFVCRPFKNMQICNYAETGCLG